MPTFQFTVPNMNCSVCAEKISKAVKRIDPAAIVQADPATKQVTVETIAADATVKQAIASAGYPVS